MEPNRLVQDELVYELTVRGISDVGNCDSMRKTLRELLRLEKLGKTFISSLPPIPFKDELTTCKNKLKEISALLEKFDGAENAYKKLETKICHVLGRLERLQAKDDDEIQLPSELLSEAIILSTELEEKVENIKKTIVQNLPIDPTLLESMSAAQASTSTRHENVNDESVALDQTVNRYTRYTNRFTRVKMLRKNICTTVFSEPTKLCCRYCE